MIRSVLCWVILATVTLALAGGARAQSLQLADGGVLLAQVVDASGDGLRVRRLDNGGTLDLRWDHLTPESALRIKQQFALVADDQDEITATVHEVRYEAGGATQTVIGRIVSEMGSGPFVVQVKGQQYSIPRANLLSVRAVEVPVTQVFTRDEFYAQRLLEAAPGDSADKHLLLALDLIKVRDYEHAHDHLQQARKLGNSLDPQRVEQTLARLARYREAQKERELLDQIQIARARGTAVEFERGVKLVEQFQREFPQSKLKTEFEAEQKRFEEARRRYFSQKVAEDWRRSIRSVAEKKVLEPGLTLDAARSYAQEKMTDDIVLGVAQRLKLDAAEVRQLWADRARYPAGKRTEHFSYGIGSWVLGEAAVLKDTRRDAAPEKSGQPAQERELEKIAEAIRRSMEARRQANQGGAAPREQTEEDWWQGAGRIEKVGWLRAFYAEFSGQLTVTGAYVQPCISCFGAGSISEAAQGGRVVKIKCYLCHGTKFVRTLRAW